MRRILIGLTSTVVLLAGLALTQGSAGAKPPQPGSCTADAAGLMIDYETSNVEYDTDPYDTPGTPPLIPDSQNGGDFDTTLGLQGPSCTNATYLVHAFRNDSAGAGGGGATYLKAGDTSDKLVLADATALFSDFSDPAQPYNDQCIAVHFTIVFNGQFLKTSQLHQVCDDNGGGGRIW